jgi:hypothetical protein|tara:strand:- start:217 stop:1359 length:1143 start_codon:yes stop_codon:yes gene_type:complete
MAKINVRSPYFVNLSTTNLTSAQIEIRIYVGGAETSWIANPQYTLTSTAINEKINFEIAELIKDYIPAAFNGTYPNSLDASEDYTTMYVDYRITETLSTGALSPVDTLGVRAFYGYGFFEDGANPQLLQGYLQSNTTILKPDDNALKIPIDNENTTSVAFFYKNEQIYSWTPTAGLKIQDQIQYVSTAAADVDNYRERVETSGGTFENNPCLQDFLRNDTIYPVDEVIINAVEGVTVLNIENVEECKYTPYKLTFINKFGAYQDIWFFKNSKLNMATNEERYKSNILTNGTYQTYNPQIKVLTKNGKRSLTLNSGFYPESNNKVFEQLFLSEKVWIEYKAKTLGITIESKSFNYKTSLTDGLINYTIDVSFAFDTINNIR